MNEKYKQYLLSDEWMNLKLDLFQKRGKKCERCNAKYNLSVHHLNYDNIFNEEPNDLIILCDKCHKKEHNIVPIKIKGKIKYKKQLTLAQKVLYKKHKSNKNKNIYSQKTAKKHTNGPKNTLILLG